MRRAFTTLSLQEVMQMLGQENLIPWLMDAPPRPPSATLLENLRRFEAFDLRGSEAAKLLLIDALLAETVPNHPNLKIWKDKRLDSDDLTGSADYLIAPKRAYLDTPLLCVVEAKRDDFEEGLTQCLAEMLACQWNNRKKGFFTDVFGIVSNGEGWKFYWLKQSGEVFETGEYAMTSLSALLGILDYVCAECASRVPQLTS